MDMYYILHKYKPNTQRIHIYNGRDELLGYMYRYNDNKFLESIAKHFSPKFVINVKSISSLSNDLIDIKLKNQLKPFIGRTEWFVYKNHRPIGYIKEARVGTALEIEINNQHYKFKSPIGKFLKRDESDNDLIIGEGKRDLNPVKPALSIHVNSNQTDLEP